MVSFQILGLCTLANSPKQLVQKGYMGMYPFGDKLISKLMIPGEDEEMEKKGKESVKELGMQSKNKGMR